MGVIYIFILFFGLFFESFANFNNENKINWIQPVNKAWESVDSIDIKKYYYGTDFGNIRGFVNPPNFKISCLDSLNWGYFAQDLNPDYCIYRATTDGGLSWETRFVDTMKMYPDHRPKPIHSIAYIKKDLILCGSDSGYILKSTDGGYKWSKKMMTKDTSDFVDSTNLNLYKGRVLKLKMYNNVGYAFTNNGMIYITEDWGDNWKKIKIEVSEGSINRIDSFSSPDSNAIFVSFLSITNEKDSLVNYYASFNRGKTWDKVQIIKGWNDTSYPRTIEYITRNIGWGTTSVKINNDFKPFLFKTNNGGKNWKMVLTDTAFGLSSYSVPYFYDTLNLAVYHNGEIYLTSDGGANWNKNKIEYEGHPEFNNFGSSNIVFYSEDKLIKGYGPFIVKYNGIISDIEKNQITKDYFINSMIVRDLLKLNLKKESYNNIEIYSILGERVHKSLGADFQESKYDDVLEINVSFLPAGVYFVRVGDWVGRFLKI